MVEIKSTNKVRSDDAKQLWKQGYNYGCLINKFETTNGFMQRILVGNSQPCLGEYAADGTLQSETGLQSSFSNGHFMAEFIPEEEIWLSGRTYLERIVVIKNNSGEKLSTRVTLPRKIMGFARTKNSQG